MDIDVFLVPYDSGHFCKRTGSGPDYFLKNGLIEFIQELGHNLNILRVESKESFNAEIETAFELNKILAVKIKSCSELSFPLIVSGNCNSSIGTLAGIGTSGTGIIWFDAHGDYNTPETTITGFLDGMGLAMLTGHCWQILLQQIPGYSPIPVKNIIHVGSLDLDYEEKKRFANDGIPIIVKNSDDDSVFMTSFEKAINNLSRLVKKVYIHIDMDVLETGSAKANHLALPGGLRVETVVDCLKIIKDKFEITACGIASVDPAFDQDKIVLGVGFEIIKTIVKKR